ELGTQLGVFTLQTSQTSNTREWLLTWITGLQVTRLAKIKESESHAILGAGAPTSVPAPLFFTHCPQAPSPRLVGIRFPSARATPRIPARFSLVLLSLASLAKAVFDAGPNLHYIRFPF